MHAYLSFYIMEVLQRKIFNLTMYFFKFMLTKIR